MTDIGDVVRIGNPSVAPDAAPFTDQDGATADPTSVELVVVKPDRTSLHYGWPVAGADGLLTRESVGRFYRDVPIDQAVTWRYRLQGTGAVTAAAEGSFRVRLRRVAA
jgi:hypothetical protein